MLRLKYFAYSYSNIIQEIFAVTLIIRTAISFRGFIYATILIIHVDYSYTSFIGEIYFATTLIIHLYYSYNISIPEIYFATTLIIHTAI